MAHYECNFGSTTGICDYQQDAHDEFDWTGQRLQPNARSNNDSPSETYVCACRDGREQLTRGSTARFKTGIFPASGESVVTVSFWYSMQRQDGGELSVFLQNHGSTKDRRMVFNRVDEPAGWTKVNFNESVSEPFQFIFEAKLGGALRSGVALSNLSFTVYSPKKLTGKSREEIDVVEESSTLAAEDGGNILEEATENPEKIYSRPTLTFLVAVVASSLLVVLMLLFAVVVICLVRKIRVLSSTAHPYEEISSTKSERGTMEAPHQKDVMINDNGSTLPRWKHVSYLSAHDSNRSSIYAEITEAEERSRFHRSGTATTGDSFVTAYSLQHIIERAANTTPTKAPTSKSTETSRRQSESGWVDNVIYESGLDMRELTSEKSEPTYRRFTGPGAGLGGISFGGWMEDLSRSRTL
ncbi:uncharacterized protein [Diadema antillarum]|uniref:uncharacterized protein n=1 Tax=Diadema antillarum TaxID=105358 RepID=UPI003A847BF6